MRIQDVVTKIAVAGGMSAGGEEGLSLSEDLEKGDFSFSSPLRIAGNNKGDAEKIAEELAQRLRDGNEILRDVRVARPGYVNVFLSGRAIGEVLREIALGPYDSLKSEKEKRTISVELVSADPIGPLQVGQARGGVLGSSWCKLAEALGHDVRREFFLNDSGPHVERLGKSLFRRHRQLRGEQTVDDKEAEELFPAFYLVGVAEEIALEHKLEVRSDSEKQEIFAAEGVEKVLQGHLRELERVGVKIDRVSTERQITKKFDVGGVLEKLAVLGGLTKGSKGDVSWTDEEGDSMRLLKEEGEPTYLLVDVAYHLNRLDRSGGAVTFLGHDHSLHSKRLLRILEALGVRDRVNVPLVGYVNLRGAQVEAEKKGFATSVGLHEFVKRNGKEEVRYFFLRRSPTSHIELDPLQLRAEKDDVEALDRLRYTHMRLLALFKKVGWRLEDIPVGEADLSYLQDEVERDLARMIIRFPLMVERAFEDFSPNKLTLYLERLANSINAWYQYTHPTKRPELSVQTEDPTRQKARLVLALGALRALGTGLELLGIEPPTSFT